MGADIKADLFEHIDGLETMWRKRREDDQPTAEENGVTLSE